jgi:L-ascorbate metabolism protein UlaG (beta-lactamase superfamily)
MRRFAKRAAIVVVSLLVVAGVALTWLRHAHPGLAPEMPRTVAAGNGAAVRVTFLGVATLLVDDGETAIMTDGFFSRPGLVRVLTTRIAPDTAVVARALRRAGVRTLAAVIPVHSHYDHALDAPEVARRTGAVLVGSASTKNIGLGAGLPAGRIVTVTPGAPLTFGRFRVTLLESVHSPNANYPGVITRPIVPPAKASEYRTGDCYSVLVEHDGRTILVQGSAGYVPNALRGRRADVVFLGVATLGKLGSAYRDAYWREVVRTTGARHVVVVHWDDFWRSLDEPLVPLPRFADDFEASMRILAARGRAEGVDVRVPVVWQPMDAFAPGGR